MKSVERLLGSAKHFPVEITLSSGDRHVIEHPDHAGLHWKTDDLIIFPDEGDFTVVINPAHIVQVRPLRRNGELV
jgi:hypothetical protein